MTVKFRYMLDRKAKTRSGVFAASIMQYISTVDCLFFGPDCHTCYCSLYTGYFSASKLTRSEH